MIFSAVQNLGFCELGESLCPFRNIGTLCVPRVAGKGQDKKWMAREQPLTGTCLLILWDPTQRLFSHEVWPPSLLWSEPLLLCACAGAACHATIPRSSGGAGESLLIVANLIVTVTPTLKGVAWFAAVNLFHL